MSPSDKQKKINRYHIDNIFLVLIIISLLLAMTLNAKNAAYVKNNVTQIPKSEEEKIRNRAKAIAWVYVLASLWFLYAAYQDYKEQEDETRYLFVLAAALLVLASFIRLYNLYYSRDQVEGSEDFAL